MTRLGWLYLLLLLWYGVSTGQVSAQTSDSVPMLAFTPTALQTIVLQPSDSEYLGCLLGTVKGGFAQVDSVAVLPVYVHSVTAVAPGGGVNVCESAGHRNTIGRVHNHPSGTNCWYLFPGTEVQTSDGVSFARSPYMLDLIVCGTLHFVWVDRSGHQWKNP